MEKFHNFEFASENFTVIFSTQYYKENKFSQKNLPNNLPPLTIIPRRYRFEYIDEWGAEF